MKFITPNRLRAQLLDLFTEYMGLTVDEAAQKLDADRLQVIERIYGLAQEGLIGKGDVRRCAVTKLDAVTFWSAEDLAEVEVAA